MSVLHTLKQFIQIIQRFLHQIIWVIVWVSLLILFYTVMGSSEASTKEVVLYIFESMTSLWWAPFVILGAYIVRPLIFVPVTLYALACGLFFGIWLGIPIALLGAIISALVAYSVGRYLRGWKRFNPPDTPSSYTQRLLSRKPFEVVLGLHLTMLPFDLVNYTSGALRIPIPSFVLGVAIGMIPGSISMVSIGAGIDFERFLSEGFSVSIIDWRYMLFAAAVFVIATSVSHWHRRQTKQ